MHSCTCCSNCQQELARLRSQYQSLLIDYAPLKENARLARQTLQIYKDENTQLHRIRIELAAYIADLQAKFGQQIVGKAPESADARREGRTVDQLNRIVACKNSQIISLKQELNLRNYEIHTLRTQIEQISIERRTVNNKVVISEGPVKDTNKVDAQNNKNTPLVQPEANKYVSNMTLTPKVSTSAYQRQKDTYFSGESTCIGYCGCLHHNRSADKTSSYRLNLIQSKIDQLEQDNCRLRRHLITKI